MKKTLLAATALSGIMLAATAPTASAADVVGGILNFFTADAPGGGFHAGSILGHARVIGVLPNVDAPAHVFVNNGADTFPTNTAGKVDVTQTIEPEVDVSYFITDHIAAEAIAGTTKHSLHLKDTVANTVTTNSDIAIGTVRLLPPTLTLKYYFFPHAAFSPYLGAGVNYTWFFDIHGDLNGSGGGGVRLSNSSIQLQDSWGGVIQAGVEYNFLGNWYANLDIKHIFLTTQATVSTTAANALPVTIRADTTLDPTIIGFGVGYKF